MAYKIVHPKNFGKDHWSLLAYIETRIHNYQIAKKVGKLDKRHLRINPKGDYKILATPVGYNSDRTWKKDYGTLLSGYFGSGNKINKKKRLINHDDVNCLVDFEKADIVEVLSLVNFYVKFTPKGQKIASELREWKNAGKLFADFVPSSVSLL